MAAARKTPPDQRARDAAVNERRRNVVIDAGAGTGKTTTLVRRLVALVAPEDGRDAIPIEDIAAVTFTRRAAGELRLRVRERLLSELAEPGLRPRRREALLAAIAGLDEACIGTIHSFADRLLGRYPAETRLSPTYEVIEATDDLLPEVVEALLHGAEDGTLASRFRGTELAERAKEAPATVLDALRAGIRPETREGTHQSKFGLDAMVEAFVTNRDKPPGDPKLKPFDRGAFVAAAQETIAAIEALRDFRATAGVNWLRATAEFLKSALQESDPVELYREVVPTLNRYVEGGRSPNLRDDFEGEKAPYAVWKEFGKELRPAMLRPLEEWLAVRLVRLYPVVVALWEETKARHEVVDQVDLLLRLSDLLVGNAAVRAECQARFRHIFVDEFQDTDPLQAEILLLLCSGAAGKGKAASGLVPGKLTIVGDPKQSIYRFRRADVATYDGSRRRVLEGGALEVELTASFRARPGLIRFVNAQFPEMLGADAEGRAFDPENGVVFHRDLAECRNAGDSDPRVHVVPLEVAEGCKAKADEFRPLEARMVPRYLRWLCGKNGLKVTDPVSGKERRAEFRDVAILAHNTTHVALLLAELDRAGVPWTARGGTLFLVDPLHRRFLLALRSLSDPKDGAAGAALMQPPFFALSPADHLRWRAEPESDHEAVRRVRAARERVVELRRRRFERPAGETVRDLLETTGLGAAVALGPNGEQRLARLRELCFMVGQLAESKGLGFDALTARLRSWVDDPPQIDPPHAVGANAVQVLTIHQAKGLEFPVVVLWDSCAVARATTPRGPWAVARDGGGWWLKLEHLDCEFPNGCGAREREKNFANSERMRLAYVACTRARDVLMIPLAAAGKGPERLWRALLKDVPSQVVDRLAPFRGETGAPWAPAPADRPFPKLTSKGFGDAELEAKWQRAASESAAPHLRPVGVAEAAHATMAAAVTKQPAAPAESDDAGTDVRVTVEGDVTPSRRVRPGRFGPVFGEAVHRAIGMALRHPEWTVTDVVARAARAVGLEEHVQEAEGDVRRALAALEREGLRRKPDDTLFLEYPVSGILAGDPTKLFTGYIDLLAIRPGRIDIVDFKTDPAPDGPIEKAYPAYVEQLRMYERLLATSVQEPESLTTRECVGKLLFSVDGWMVELMRWAP
jgi:ATP-dependent exoDNAse (exonuclease V) beta subunit